LHAPAPKGPWYQEVHPRRFRGLERYGIEPGLNRAEIAVDSSRSTDTHKKADFLPEPSTKEADAANRPLAGEPRSRPTTVATFRARKACAVRDGGGETPLGRAWSPSLRFDLLCPLTPKKSGRSVVLRDLRLGSFVKLENHRKTWAVDCRLERCRLGFADVAHWPGRCTASDRRQPLVNRRSTAGLSPDTV